MGWELIGDSEALETIAGEFLRADPVAHTSVLGVLGARATRAASSPDPSTGERPGPVWAVLRRDGKRGAGRGGSAAGEVAGVCWWTPPYGVGVTDVAPVEALELVSVLAAARPDVAAAAPCVVGPRSASAALAAGLAALAGRTVVPQLLETLYRLNAAGDLVTGGQPAPCGHPRLASPEDVPILARWLLAFVQEAGTTQPADPLERISGSVADGSMWVWDFDGPRAMVGGRPTGAGVARLGPVYTPPAARGCGVATALVAHVCRALSTAGSEVVTLYADDANRTSTGIYRRMGFRPVLAWAEHALT